MLPAHTERDTTECDAEASARPPDPRALLDRIKQLNADLAAAQQTLNALLARRLHQDLHPGVIVNVRELGPAFQAKVMRGTAHQGTSLFRIDAPPRVNADLGSPALTRWDAVATPLRESDRAPYRGQVTLRGYLFTLQQDRSEFSDHEQLIRWLQGGTAAPADDGPP